MRRGIEIGMSEDDRARFDQTIKLLQRVVELIDRANDLQAEANTLNLAAKRLLLRNARMLEKGRAALHTIDGDEDGGTSTGG